MEMFDVTEKSIAELRAVLESGHTTAVELVHAYRARIERHDRPASRAGGTSEGGAPEDGVPEGGVPEGRAPDGGIPLNSVIVDNPWALDEARASDERRAAGAARGPLDGIPFTAKDSFMARGLTVAAGSPAFADLVAQWDAFTIERLRDAGAVLLGLTNMPPMANGGMQRGLYGRAESPYNPGFLTSAFASGSSNGSGTATAASFGAFGLGEETWSSGRAPASCNALCAYTPSRGMVSVRGNWPLVPTMDVVVPHTRTMADLLEVLEVIVADDHTARGDFWRVQPWIHIPRSTEVRPDSYPALAAVPTPDGGRSALAGSRLGVPRMYINADPDAGTGPDHTGSAGLGGPMGQRIQTRASVIALWEAARAALEEAGAAVVEVDFPVVTNYEGDRPGAPTIATRGLVSADYLHAEVTELSAWAWEDFLQANGDPELDTLAHVDGTRIFPHPPGALPDRYDGFGDDIAAYPETIRSRRPGATVEQIRHLAEGLAGLEQTRRTDLEDWMDGLGLDAVVFPALADVGPADADVDPRSAELAWRNGTWVANGNLVPRHLGIPTVTVPMGTARDIGMPFGLTFAGRAYDDTVLLRLACAFETTGPRRSPPPRTTAQAVTTLSPTTHSTPRTEEAS
jgi:amidase